MAAFSNNPSVEMQRYMRGVSEAMRVGDMASACRIGGEAVSRGIENEQLLTLAAYGRINAGDDPKALEFAERARTLAPRSVDVLTALGMCLSRNGRFREAVDVYDAALKQAPRATQLRFNKACALEEMSEVSRAAREFERVLDAEPRNAEALAHLANLAAQRGDVKTARDFATRALQSDPRQSAAVLALAGADIEEKKFEDALTRLKPLTAAKGGSMVNRSIALGLSGDALDGLQRYDEAFAAYDASKTTLKALYQPLYEKPGSETAHARVTRLEKFFESAPEDMWKARKSNTASGKTHVFLVGFPRSGTTLLEQILASHPDVTAMEERDCLIDAQNEFLATPEGLERLQNMHGDELDAAREAYWQRVSEANITPSTPVFVDKMPLNTVLLCLVAKLFPQAKILFALRDPRDVVLSCFRRRFGMNAQMYELITQKGAAQYYDAVMRLADIYRKKLGLDIHDLRYEAMVADLKTEMRGVCDFLGLPWDDSLRDFADRAKARSIDTPSAAQVARGLYTQGAGQWQHYAVQMAPILPLLALWLSYFGYSD
jgi:tetratricopeptide (TPR) repeat protein